MADQPDHALAVQTGWDSGPCNLEERRIQIGAVDRGPAFRTGPVMARPGDDERDPDAPLVQLGLASAQRRIGCHVRLAAVVGHKRQHGLPCDAQFLKLGADHPHALIDRLQHSGQLGIVAVLARSQLAGIAGHLVGFPGQPGMGRVMREEQEEPALRVSGDEVHCFLVQAVG